MNIRELAEKHNPYIVEQRRWFHRRPERSLEEKGTTERIAKELEAMGLKPKFFDDIFGCYADLEGSGPGPTVMLRADIDALTGTEKTGLDFASEVEGTMHACGHDAHIAMLLGAAKILCDLKGTFPGRVRFLFQAAEETAVGAREAVKRGAADGVDAAFGMHIWGQLPSGRFNFAVGDRMASCDTFSVKVHGVSAHGSAPHLGKDAIVAAAAIVMNLQTIVSRNNDPLNAAVVSIGQFDAGQRFNIIANEAELIGTTRTYNPEFRMSLEGRIRDIAQDTAKALGCTAETEYNYLTAAVINDDAELVDIARTAVTELFGADQLVEMEKITGSEDFPFLMEGRRAVYGFLGAANPSLPGSGLSNHHECFTVDEAALPKGAAVMADFARRYLTGAAK